MRNIKNNIGKLTQNILSKSSLETIDNVELAKLKEFKINPYSLPSVLKASYFYQKKDYKQSSVFYSKALLLQPDNAYLNFKYGMCHYKMKNWIEANKYIKKAVGLGSSNKNWNLQLETTVKHLSNNNKLTEKALKDKVKKSSNDLNVIENYAAVLLKNKKYWLAKFQYAKLIEINPDSESALFNMGLIHEKLSDYENALVYFNAAEKISINDIIYKYHIGYCQERLGNLEDANIYYGFVEAYADPESDIAKFGVGVLHERNDYWDCALNAYVAFMNQQERLDPNLFYKIAIAYEHLYMWDAAAESYQKALDHSQLRYAGWCYKCGQAYEKSAQYDKAVIYYQEAVARSNNYNDYWWFRLGYALEQAGLFKESAEAFVESRRRKYLHTVSPQSVIKNKNQDYLSYYAEYYETLDVNNQIVLFESFLASTVSGNPYAILSHMLKGDYDFTYVVAIKEDTIIPESLKFNKNIIFINRDSDAYLRYLCRAKYLINNVSFPYYFTRKEGQVYLNTWHGTPMKTLGKDIKNPFQDHANVARNFLQATHIISQNRKTSEVLLDRYDVKNMFSGKIAETGYPRVDLSLNLNDEQKCSIARSLGIELDKPIVLYAPTWRGTSESKVFDKDKLKKDLVYLADKKYQIVFRGHHLAESLLSDINLPNIIVAPKTIDTNELLGITDVLITDYSSILFDFLLLDKPIISYIYDFDSYKEERGMYFDTTDILGEVCKNIKQVKEAINTLYTSKNSNIDSDQIKKYVPYDDGNACERTVQFMFDLDDSHVWNYEKKKQLLFFCGPFIPNGISRSFLNLMSSIEDADFNVTVVINRADVQNHSSRLEEFTRLPDSVNIVSRVGAMPMTLEEISLRNKFENNYSFYSQGYEKALVNLYKREARRLFGDSSISTVINFEGYALFWAPLLSQVNAEKKVIFQHNDKYQEWKTKFPYLEGVFRWYKYYDNIISVSKGTMEKNKSNLATQFNLPEDKFIYINNALNIEQIILGANEDIEMEDYFTQFKGTKFINIGRMSHEKDQVKLIEAFYEVRQQHSSVRLYILGEGDLRPELERKISSLKLEDDVYLLGQKSNPFAYLKQADVFVLSSNHEGQPMVLLEALTLGVPVIATDITGNRSVLGDKYGKLVENNKEGLVAGMVSYIEDGASNIKFDATSYQNKALNKFYSIVT